MRAALALDVRVERLPLKAPFRIAGYTFTETPVALVTLTQGALTGAGEAAGVYYLEDTPERIAATIESHRTAIEAGVTREQLAAMLPAGGARNALDCALWDLEAKRAGRPVWKLAGLQRVIPRITTFTLGADDPAVVEQRARAWTHARALKLKLDGDLDADIERLKAVRAARPDIWLGVDANQGYTPDSLERLLSSLLDARVRLLEQPFARGRESDLEDVHCPIPIAADESAQRLTDLTSLVGRFDVVNIKLDKCGGLTEGLQIAEEARRLGLKPMVGNMVGTSLAMAPAFVLAQLCDFIDLDGPTFVVKDRTPGVQYDAGSIWCPDEVWGAPVKSAA
jgi:L-alanine-DL-glutamate epimerase-like enolase superfamily enzyme